MTDTYRKESRKDWYRAGQLKPGIEQIQLGCLQRIADATEAMANNYSQILAENQNLRMKLKLYQSDEEFLRRQLAAQKGVATKLRQKLKQAREQPE